MSWMPAERKYIYLDTRTSKCTNLSVNIHTLEVSYVNKTIKRYYINTLLCSPNIKLRFMQLQLLRKLSNIRVETCYFKRCLFSETQFVYCRNVPLHTAKLKANKTIISHHHKIAFSFRPTVPTNQRVGRVSYISANQISNIRGIPGTERIHR